MLVWEKASSKLPATAKAPLATGLLQGLVGWQENGAGAWCLGATKPSKETSTNWIAFKEPRFNSHRMGT